MLQSIAYIAAGTDYAMDSLSTTVSTAVLVDTSCEIVKQLYDLHGALKDALWLLRSVASKCRVVSTALAVLQDFTHPSQHGFDRA